MRTGFKIKHIVFGSISVLLMLIMIGFTGVKNDDKPVRDVIVEIDGQNGNYFIDRNEVINLMNANQTDYVLGLTIDQLDLKLLEQRVENNPFVKDAQVYRDVKGNLLVEVQQAEPIARIVNRKGPDLYIDKDGSLLPVSKRYTARVPVIEMDRGFSWEKNIDESLYGEKLLTLLNYIYYHEFWNAQIAGMKIEKNGEITLHPQVTRQDIKLGMPDELDVKFKKLMVFYKKILPNKGWNTYSYVNLKFSNQIVCE